MILGLLLIAFISIVCGIITWNVKNIIIRIAIVGFCSFITAYLVYWVPAWSNSVDEQYLSRKHLFMQSWIVVGFTAGSIAVIFSKIVNKNDR